MYLECKCINQQNLKFRQDVIGKYLVHKPKHVSGLTCCVKRKLRSKNLGKRKFGLKNLGKRKFNTKNCKKWEFEEICQDHFSFKKSIQTSTQE